MRRRPPRSAPSPTVPPHRMTSRIRPPFRLAAAVCLGILAWLWGCQQEAPAPDFVARLDGQYLTQEEVSEALAALPVPTDSTEARQQIIEQWVTNQLLYQEALRRDLTQDPAERRLLEENERSVLVSALISRLYEEDPAAPSAAELQAYFERHKEQLRLREPYLRVRYLATADAEDAAAVREELASAPDAARDSVWTAAVQQHADDVQDALQLSSNFYPESRLFAAHPALREVVSGLTAGQTGPVFESDGRHHVLQLVARVPAGTVPELSWIEDELRHRLTIQSRKQMYARQVQRLRNEALAREELEIR